MEEAERLERKLRHVSESSMRRELVLEALEERSVSAALALLQAALHRPAGEAPRLELLRETALAVLVRGGATQPLAYERIEALYAAAAERDDEVLMRLLRTPTAEQSMGDPAANLPREVGEIEEIRRHAAAELSRRSAS